MTMATAKRPWVSSDGILRQAQLPSDLCWVFEPSNLHGLFGRDD